MRGKQIVLSKALRYEVAEAHHKQLGHLGAARTVSAVAENYTWSGMQLYISEYCANCQVCIQNKTSRSAKEPLQSYELDDVKPRSIVAFDVTTLPWATQQHRYFSVIADLFSKYLELVAMKDQHGSTIKSAILDAWVQRHGRPNIAVSDQARDVDGEVSSWESRNADHSHTIPKGTAKLKKCTNSEGLN